MYVEYAKLYQLLVLFQARVLTHAMNGENEDDSKRRTAILTNIVERAIKRCDKNFPELEKLGVGPVCDDGLVNCHGVCVDPGGCWDHSQESSARD